MPDQRDAWKKALAAAARAKRATRHVRPGPEITGYRVPAPPATGEESAAGRNEALDPDSPPCSTAPMKNSPCQTEEAAGHG